LRERAEELGGSCTITPGAEAGTVVCVHIPLDVPDQVGGGAL
jgi:signal transduction histidine kinase